MYVVLDSTALIADFRLASVAVKGLLRGSASGVIRLVVPEIVVLETVNKLREKADELAKKADSLKRDANRIGLEPLSSSLLSPDEESVRYEASLRSQLSDHAVHVPQISATPHRFLVEKAIARMAPFADKGTGYRDALIWETVKEILLASNESLVFVTYNSSDFGSSAQGIRPSLLDELTGEGIDLDRLKIVASATEAAEITLHHAKRLFEKFQERLEEDEDFRDQLFNRLVGDADLSLSDGGSDVLDHMARFLEVHTLDNVSFFSPLRSWLVSEGRIGIEFEAEADAEADVEYEDSPSYYFDVERDSRRRGFVRTRTTTVTATLVGQLEFDGTTEEASSISTSIYTLSKPFFLD